MEKEIRQDKERIEEQKKEGRAINIYSNSGKKDGHHNSLSRVEQITFLRLSNTNPADSFEMQ